MCSNLFSARFLTNKRSWNWSIYYLNLLILMVLYTPFNTATASDQINKSSPSITLSPEEQAWIKAHPDIRLGAPTSYPPLVIQNRKGPHTGMLIDLFELINQKLSTNIQLHIEDSWPSVLGKAKNRTIDGLASGGRSANRAEHLNSTEKLYSTYYYVFSRTNDQLQLKSVKELDGLRIGYKKADAPVKSLLDKYVGVTPVSFIDNATMTKGLMNKEVDVLVAWISYDFWRRATLQGAVDNILLATDTPLDMYIHIRKDWPELIPILNKALSSIRENELPKLMDKWFIERPQLPVTQKFTLSVKEQAWLAKENSVQVRILDVPPFLVDKKGDNPSGIAIDYLNLISQRTGIQFDYQNTGNGFSEAVDGITKHEGPDLMPIIVSTPERQKSILFTDNYITSPIMIFVRSNETQFITNTKDLVGKKVSILQGSVEHEMIKDDFPNLELLPFGTVLRAMEAVASEEADAYVGNLTVASYHILHRGLFSLKLAGPTSFSDHVISMGIRNDWPELASLINKGLKSITEEEHAAIRNRYISVQYNTNDINKYIKWILLVALLALGVIFVFFLWARSLKKQVLGRTSELVSSEEQYRYLFENMAQGSFRQTVGGELTDVNSAALEIFGLSYDQFVGKTSKDPHWRVVHEDGTEFPGEDHPSTVALKTGEECRDVVAGIYNVKKNKYVWVTINAVPQFKKGETHPFQVFVTMHDITARKEAAEIERTSQEFLNNILNNIGDPVFVKDDQHRFTLINDAFCSILDIPREEIIGKTLFEKLLPDEMEHFLEIDKQVLEDGGQKTSEEILTIRDRKLLTVLTKKTRYVAGNGDKFIVGVTRDITELKEAEKEHKNLTTKLHQSQKMEAIGTLAGGIAHDFNNILSVIIGFTELTIGDVEKESPIQEDLQEVYAAGLRAKDLVQQILTFARKSDEEMKPIFVDTTIKEVLKFIRSSTPTTIELKQNIISSSCILGNKTQIHRIMMNLCTNAAHAMEEKGGILEVTLKDITINKAIHRKERNFKCGNYIEITVSDTGSGIEPHVIDKIFEPYFTTKNQGDGTGMGLAMVHGIVESYNGEIIVDSRLGKGSTFTIYLPVAKGSKDYQQQKIEDLPTGNERILFIDDEAQITKMASRILGNLGYSITTKTDSVEALELFCSKPDDFDLVISDVTMPKITGDQLSQKLLENRPGIPIILCTGYTNRLSEKKAMEIGVKAFVSKPIIQADLATTVRRVLDGAIGS